MKSYIPVFILAAVLAVSGQSAWPQDLFKGLAAFGSGDFATAIEELGPLAEQGDVLAQSKLGERYENGHGVPQNYIEAVKWYRLAALQGNALAQSHLGEIYDTGKGVPEDDAEAVKWYRLAAEQGSAFAQNNLGSMYYAGEGVQQNYAEAVRWYRLAAEQGNAMAQGNLGGMYQNGLGVSQDYFEAIKWFAMVFDCKFFGGAKRNDCRASRHWTTQVKGGRSL